MYWVAALVGFVSTFLASVEDLRTRLVPDWLSYSTVATAVFIHGSVSLVNHSFDAVVQSLFGVVIAWVVGAVFFYTGQWGGGDAKLLMGIGGLFGVSWTGVPLFFVFLLNMFIAGTLVGLVWSSVVAYANAESFTHAYRDIRTSRTFRVYLAITGVVALASGVSMLYLPGRVGGVVVAGGVGLVALTYLWAFVKAVEDACMHVSVGVDELVPGDWVVEDIYEGEERIHGVGDLGVTAEQIEQIREVRDEVEVKEGIPFVPSFFLAFVATVAWGNWLMFV